MRFLASPGRFLVLSAILVGCGGDDPPALIDAVADAGFDATPPDAGTEYDCADGIDNNGNGVADCEDPDCNSLPLCLPETDCTDGIDNDGDATTDCRDTGCDGWQGCEYGVELTCDDDFDNDGFDGADCADTDCAGVAGCEPDGEVTCDDGDDNDNDALIDCEDPSCDGLDGCEVAAEVTCDDAFDNDADGLADCADDDCDGISGCEVGAEASCDDAFDNDADGDVDCDDADCETDGACVVVCPPGSSIFSYDAPMLPASFGMTNATRAITVSDVGVVRAMAVSVDMTHTYVSDVVIDLVATNNTAINLTSGNGGSGDDFIATVFNDTATLSIIGAMPPFTGAFRPEQPFSTFNGYDSAQTWTFQLNDTFASADHGNVTNLQLHMCVCNGTAGCEFGPACNNGRDDDGDALVDCTDSDCAADPRCVPEFACSDGMDSDLDLLVDCDDPDCNGISGCEFGVEVSCMDGFDNDSDGTIDCADANCTTSAWCSAEADCGNGADDDADGFADCLDIGCNGMSGCQFGTETDCGDAFDNDGDGAADCSDANCASEPACLTSCPAGSTLMSYTSTMVPVTTTGPPVTSAIEVTDVGVVRKATVLMSVTHTWDADLTVELIDEIATTVVLTSNNGGSLDNYTDTFFVDGAPPITAGTAPFTGAFAPEQPLAAYEGHEAAGTWTLRLSDNFSAADHGTLTEYVLGLCVCNGTAGCEFGNACNNARDDDGDLLADCDDPDCAAIPTCAPENCADGVDNNVNGLVDCFDPDCAMDAACLPDEPSCNNGLDEDMDGLVDCLDDGCDEVDGCELGQEHTCNDGADNDVDGAMDCADADCAMACASLTCAAGDVLLQFTATDLPQTISAVGTVELNSYIAVNKPGTIVNTAMEFSATHTWDSDLDYFLFTPSGVTRDVTSGNGGSSDNYTNTVFVDSAATAITAGVAPFTGSFRPEQPFSGIAGTLVGGMWRVRLRDNADFDGGSWTENRIAFCVDVP